VGQQGEGALSPARLRDAAGSASLRTWALVGASLVAFAANSLLCRAALAGDRTDPATFTLIRIGSGAVALFALTRGGGGRLSAARSGVVARAVSLFAYAALFSWAYARISAGVGALVLFGCVQLTMVAAAVRAGAGPRGLQAAGIALAFAGLVVLTLPGASAPDPLGTALMAGSGVAWGVYTWLGRRAGTPLATTATSFLCAAPLALLAAAGAALLGRVHADGGGVAAAVASGAVTSGLGYAVWYAVLPSIDTARAAVVQTAVPVLAALAGVLFLGESVGVRWIVSSLAILGGIVLVARARTP
jgi:drug/metabolite transporter (DMT)-like permease